MFIPDFVSVCQICLSKCLHETALQTLVKEAKAVFPVVSLTTKPMFSQEFVHLVFRSPKTFQNICPTNNPSLIAFIFGMLSFKSNIKLGCMLGRNLSDKIMPSSTSAAHWLQSNAAWLRALPMCQVHAVAPPGVTCLISNLKGFHLLYSKKTLKPMEALTCFWQKRLAVISFSVLTFLCFNVQS